MPLDVKQDGIIIEAEVQSCVVEIYLNGIPVGLCGLGPTRKLTRPVHEYLIDGEKFSHVALRSRRAAIRSRWLAWRRSAFANRRTVAGDGVRVSAL